jgi:hypothetical protein
MIRWGCEGWVVGTDQVSVLVVLYSTMRQQTTLHHETKSYLLYLLSCELLDTLRHGGGLL